MTVSFADLSRLAERIKTKGEKLKAQMARMMWHSMTCTECGRLIERDSIKYQESDTGAYGPECGNPAGKSFNQVCQCGAENSFREAEVD